MKITRRNFLKGSLATLFLAGSGIPVYSSNKVKKNLVVIMLRGGMDLDRFKEIISWIRGENIFSPHYLANNKGIESFECIGVERL